MKLPTIRNFAGSNAWTVQFENITLYYHYEALIAFKEKGMPTPVVSENVWSQTTGRYINCIPGVTRDTQRTERDLFLVQLRQALARQGLELE